MKKQSASAATRKTALYQFARTTNLESIKKPSTFSVSSIRQQKSSDKQSLSGLGSSSFSSQGLDTLLHLHNDYSLSSIRSGPRPVARQTLISQAQGDIEQLRAKRIQLQQQWSAKHRKYNRRLQNEQEDDELNSSEVVSYDHTSEQPSMLPKHKKQPAPSQDRFALELRLTIRDRKCQDLLNGIQKMHLKWFIRHLSRWCSLCDFKDSSNNNMLRKCFIGWGEISEVATERARLRQAIVNRLRKRNKGDNE